MQRQKLTVIGFVLTLVILWTFFAQPAALYSQIDEEETMNKEFKEAENPADYEQFIVKYKPDELAFVAVQKLAKPYLDKKDWQGAIAVFQKYQADFPNMEYKFKKTIALLDADEESLAVNNLGNGINTEKSEHSPVISADGKKIYFARTKLKLLLVNKKYTIKSDEDVFVSTFVGNSWTNAIKMENSICTDSPEAPQGISSDGNSISLFGNYGGSFGRGDNFYVEKTVRGWSEVNHYKSPINGFYFDADAMKTADGKAIIFTSDRPGCIGQYHEKGKFYYGHTWGNIDIYISVKTDSGWSDAINLGETINTPYCEYTPFLHPDGKTLYFSSDGHYGLGNLDVFKATRLNDSSWTEWSEPVNLGKEINSPNSDWGYKIATSGELAFFSIYDKPDGFGMSDIYSIELPKKAKPNLVITIAGKITDPDGNPLEAEIKWNDLTLMKEAGEAKSDPQTGEYFIVLPAGHEYSYNAEKEGYFGKSEHVDLTNKEGFERYSLDIILYPIIDLVTTEKNSPTVEIIVFFDLDKWGLQEKSTPDLNRLVKLLGKHQELKIEIQGHTDNIGTKEYNKILSQKRARSVLNYLVGAGIKKERLISKGFGETHPVKTNETEEGREKNRRVEIKFLEKFASSSR